MYKKIRGEPCTHVHKPVRPHPCIGVAPCTLSQYLLSVWTNTMTSYIHQLIWMLNMAVTCGHTPQRSYRSLHPMTNTFTTVEEDYKDKLLTWNIFLLGENSTTCGVSGGVVIYLSGFGVLKKKEIANSVVPWSDPPPSKRVSCTSSNFWGLLTLQFWYTKQASDFSCDTHK